MGRHAKIKLNFCAKNARNPYLQPTNWKSIIAQNCQNKSRKIHKFSHFHFFGFSHIFLRVLSPKINFRPYSCGGWGTTSFERKLLCALKFSRAFRWDLGIKFFFSKNYFFKFFFISKPFAAINRENTNFEHYLSEKLRYLCHIIHSENYP